MDPFHYQNIIDGYEVISIDCSFKDLDAIEMDLTLINQRRGLVKSPAPIGAAVRSVSEFRQETPNPPQNPASSRHSRFPTRSSGSLSKLSWRKINTSYVVTYTLNQVSFTPAWRTDIS